MNRLLMGSLLLIVAVSLFISGCGGGGGGTPTPAPAATKAVLTVSLQGTLPAGTSIGSVDLTVTLPAGITAKADAVTGETNAGVVVASGNAAGAELLGAKYTAATATTPGNIRIGLAKSSGFNAGECLTLNLDIGGAVPSVTGFGTTGLSVSDVNGNALSGMAAALTLQTI